MFFEGARPAQEVDDGTSNLHCDIRLFELEGENTGPKFPANAGVIYCSVAATCTVLRGKSSGIACIIRHVVCVWV